jgi:hypothetical protein
VGNNVITEAHNGFRKNKSTDTTSQTFIESMQEALDKEVHAIGTFFDLTKAYEVINHDIVRCWVGHVTNNFTPFWI